jgi:hypothetical protein
VESLSYGFLVYKFNHLKTISMERRRTRVLYFLYSDAVERNTETREYKRRNDCWPLWSWERDLDGNRRTQVFAPLEPFFPNNRTIWREYSPLWAFWRAERNVRTGAASESLLWNLYRHEKLAKSKKISLLFGVIQYESTGDGGRWRLCGINMGGKKARATAPK